MIQPVILSGGAGTRLWPLSRELYPKQLLPLVSTDTMLQETLLRLEGIADLAAPLVVCNEEHRFLVAEQLRAIDKTAARIMLEPIGRNTAPALTLAALALAESAPAAPQQSVMLVMPADHVIQDVTAFQAAVQEGLELAQQGYLVTFGIVPDSAETGYGYIQRSEAIEGHQALKVRSFVEKPDKATAEAYLDSGDYYWNSGMFMMTAAVWLEEIGARCPDIYAHCEQAYRQGKADVDFFRVDATAFTACPADSIDYAVMEKAVGADAAHPAAVVPLSAGWSDVGVWSSLWQVGAKDAQGNVIRGEVMAQSTENSLLYSNHRLVATVGLKDTIVVETADALLVANRHHTQDVKKVVEWLKAQKRSEHLTHRRVHRPWGSYETIDFGDRYQVKRITVNTGAALSLQLHHHRAEHWIVVRGTAQVTRGEEHFLVTENQSTYIPIGTRHRLENKGAIPLEMIEVQSGSYLGEDDIVRFDDHYGRST
ncbi:MAG: mannose-1-phosphate guanylyltransferase/mannose-6-phosphate isomerase [Gammaproteobacteria bacterium]